MHESKTSPSDELDVVDIEASSTVDGELSLVTGDFPDWDPSGSLAGDILLPGEVLAERYEIVDIIGEGGFGVVYKARQRELGQWVAVKTLRRSLVEYDEAAQRFRREALLARHLTHPHTIRIIDFGQTRTGILYICMEYLEGQTLEDRIVNQGPMSMVEALRIGLQISKSLTEAHQNGIVHRDMKPSNVFLCSVAGSPDFVMVLDFGIAKVTRPWDEKGYTDKLTRTGAAFGSPAYMSPEQVRGVGIGAASDIYALGLILIEAMTGFQVVDGNSPFDVAVKQATPAPVLIPDWIEDSPIGALLRRCVAKPLTERYPDASALLDELERVDLDGLQRYEQKLRANPKFEERSRQRALEHAETQRAEWDFGPAPDDVRWGRRGMLFAIGVSLFVLISLGLTLVLTRQPTPPLAPPVAEQSPPPLILPVRPFVSMAVTGAIHAQAVLPLPVDLAPERLALPPGGESAVFALLSPLGNAQRFLSTLSLAGPLRAGAEIYVTDPRPLNMARAALTGAISGSCALATVSLAFDSTPRAFVLRGNSTTPLGRTPFELQVIKSATTQQYRIERRDFNTEYRSVRHDRDYQASIVLRKRTASPFAVKD
ncbi:MAG: serine/threonine-protein kinase [Myxococcota bacterium]|jgi:serine/threonine-protein kinase|nr:serine/threonine-protein kinase [Myxococcota bacterium]